MVAPGEVSAVEAHVAMSEALGRLAGDVRLGRAGNWPDIQLGFTTLDGQPVHEAELEAPAEDEDFIGRAEFEVSAKIGRQEDASPLGRLVVTALASGQGTGKTFQLPSEGERTAGIGPVSREDVHTELHVPISTLVPGRTATRIHTFVNHLRLLGVQPDGDGGNGHIIRLGVVGQAPDFFKQKLEGNEPGLGPHPTFTLLSGLEHGERIALFNASNATQLAGTLALYERPTDDPDDFLHSIVASEPMGIGVERVTLARADYTGAPDLETEDIPPAPVASR